MHVHTHILYKYIYLWKPCQKQYEVLFCCKGKWQNKWQKCLTIARTIENCPKSVKIVRNKFSSFPSPSRSYRYFLPIKLSAIKGIVKHKGTEERMQFETGLFWFVFNLTQSVYSYFIIAGFGLVGVLVFRCGFFFPIQKEWKLPGKGWIKISV